MVIGFWNQGLTKARMVFKKEGYLIPRSRCKVTWLSPLDCYSSASLFRQICDHFDKFYMLASMGWSIRKSLVLPIRRTIFRKQGQEERPNPSQIVSPGKKEHYLARSKATELVQDLSQTLSTKPP